MSTHKIRIGSIKHKVSDYAKSDRGKKRMDSIVSEYVENGISETSAGAKIMTVKDMETVAKGMISILKKNTHDLPETVKAHFNSLSYTKPKPISGRKEYSVGVYFADDLSRPSLLIVHGKNKGKRTGDGVFNIVGLFDSGYSASKRVFGVWERKDGDVYTGSRTSREGLNFMERAVNQFNSEYGDRFNVHAYIDPEFYGDPQGDSKDYDD